MENDQARAALAASKLKESANALRLLEHDNVAFDKDSDTLAVPSALLQTYQARLDHLATFETHHARRLKLATTEFCEVLAQLDDEQQVAYGRLDDTLLGSYIVWYTQTDRVVVGCLYVIGKSEVAEDVWTQLWQQDA